MCSRSSSDFDNSPNVVLEAMACGLAGRGDRRRRRRASSSPIGVGGAIVPPRDAGALATALGRYLCSAPACSATPARSTARGREPNSPGAPARCACSTSTSACSRRAGTRARPHEGRAFETTTPAISPRPRRSSASTTTSGIACRCAWRRCRSRSATSAPAFRASTGTRARRSRWSGIASWCRCCKTLIASAPRHHRAARLHASGLSGRLRVSGRTGSRAPRARRAASTSTGTLRRADLGVRAAAQRAVEARTGRGRRRRPQPARIVPVVPAVDAALGSAARSATGGACARYRACDRTVAGRIDSSIRTCCATAGHAEFGCHSLVPGTTLEELVAGFEEARRAGGDFCLATHYWEVDARHEGRDAAVSRSRRASCQT